MLATMKDREILEEESCSDHNLIKYTLKINPDIAHKYHSQGPRFIIKENQNADFHKIYFGRFKKISIC